MSDTGAQDEIPISEIPDLDEEMFKTNIPRELQDEDFYDLNAADGIALRATGCTLVLFYKMDDADSEGVRVMFSNLADQIANINFYAVNVSRRKNIMEMWYRVTTGPHSNNTPWKSFSFKATEGAESAFPTIVVYREGGGDGISWPQAFYDGPWDQESLSYWTLNLACKENYSTFASDGYVHFDDTDGSGGQEQYDEQAAAVELGKEEVQQSMDNVEGQFEDQVVAEGLTDPNVLANPPHMPWQDFQLPPRPSPSKDPGYIELDDDDQLDFGRNMQ
jgi:hypothetical protein